MHRFSFLHVPLLHLISSTLDRKPFPQLWSQSILYTFYRQFAEYQLAEEHLRPNELRVVEEGLIHRGFTLFGYLPEEASNDELQRYIDVIPLPSIAVFVDASPEECCERLLKRPEPPIPLQKRGPSEVINQLTIGRRCLQGLAALSKQRNVKVFRIANSLDETSTAEERLYDVLDYLSTSEKN
jgi:hypothetical protein